MNPEIDKFNHSLYFIDDGKVLTGKPFKISFIELPAENIAIKVMLLSFKVIPSRGKVKIVEKYSRDCFYAKEKLLFEYQIIH